MEIVVLVLAVWLAASAVLALLVARFLRVADRRERETTITTAPRPYSAPVPHSARQTRSAISAEVHETA